jgi:hypothetical protein
VSWLVRHEVLREPVKHALVSTALAWRGMFVAKSWGLVAWACALTLIAQDLARRRASFVLASAPAVFMLAFHAMVSVSIPRYNLILLPMLAWALGSQLERAWSWLEARARPASRA